MKILRPAKPEQYFYCADGTVLRSIHELERKLRTINNETYRHHVNQSKNDFHNWIRDVFQEHDLANEILTAGTQADAAFIVRKHLSKAMQANSEIENAIRNVLSARSKTLAAARKTAKAARPTRIAAKKAKKLRQKKIAVAKEKRKVNKIRSHRKNNRSSGNKKVRRKKQKRGFSLFARKPTRKRSRAARASASKNGKKQVNRWLNWLKLVPTQQ